MLFRSVESGAPVDRGGTIGAYMIPALAELYSQTGNEAYLRTAERAFAFYCKRDLDQFTCTAGALDTVCIDKETSGALIMGAILLYELTGERTYLTEAENATYYFCSWMYHYDGLYAPDSDFAQVGYHTSGGTSVSAQHHHIDPWGAAMAGWLLKLAQYTGEAGWRTRARMLYRNTTQCVALTENQAFHGRGRPLGSQNEAYCECRWPDFMQPLEAGRLNDWLVAWPGAFRLWALDMAQALGEEY